MSEDRVSIEEKELEKVTGGASKDETKTVIACPDCGAPIVIDLNSTEEVLGMCDVCHKRIRGVHLDDIIGNN